MPRDDFMVGTVASLAPGASRHADGHEGLSPPPSQPAPMCMTINGSEYAGRVICHHRAAFGRHPGHLRPADRQRQPLRHRGHGGHGLVQSQTFGDLIGSDKAEFRFTDSKGNVVLDFYCDYITASSAFPSATAAWARAAATAAWSAAVPPIFCSPPPRSARISRSRSSQTGYLVNSPPETAPAVGRLGPCGLGLRQQLHGGRKQECLRGERVRWRDCPGRSRLAA